ncbi:hypothetical protein EGM63_10145 [Mycobacterium avium subsp. paratuberculosis]|nr:hypothetical protein CEP84_07045 [Mycobacterium avium subsp. paratuberculosis]ASF97731.1 hypothetical protein CEG92_19455 [Mycobacterium avium subsp. paratuberculosis]AYQ68143.1 hypothetical protein EC390_07700 [Mycobacterium avium subsp. paratuberculosis]AYQ78440.1 hypothetical protein EC391_15035 [Mycobacterium avium subsp. paratuberculosis]AZA69660.1 hypothetical protein EGM63_10145 [Mycobacterium avium subsp. paratuberculosis]
MGHAGLTESSRHGSPHTRAVHPEGWRVGDGRLPRGDGGHHHQFHQCPGAQKPRFQPPWPQPPWPHGPCPRPSWPPHPRPPGPSGMGPGPLCGPALAKLVEGAGAGAA